MKKILTTLVLLNWVSSLHSMNSETPFIPGDRVIMSDEDETSIATVVAVSDHEVYLRSGGTIKAFKPSELTKLDKTATLDHFSVGDKVLVNDIFVNNVDEDEYFIFTIAAIHNHKIYLHDDDTIEAFEPSEVIKIDKTMTLDHFSVGDKVLVKVEDEYYACTIIAIHDHKIYLRDEDNTIEAFKSSEVIKI